MRRCLPTQWAAGLLLSQILLPIASCSHHDISEPQTLKPSSSITPELGRINSLAVAPDGKTILIRPEKGIVVWDLAAGKEKFSFDDKMHYSCALFSPNGKFIAAGRDDHRLRICDASSGKVLHSLALPESVHDIAFSAASGDLASVCADNTIRIWDPETGESLAMIKDVPDAATASLALSPNGKLIATAGWKDKVVRLWDMKEAKLIAELKGHAVPIETVAFAPNGEILASAGGSAYEDTTEVKLWNVADRKEIATLTGQEYQVVDTAFSPNGKLLVTAGGEQYLKKAELIIWDVKQQIRLAVCEGHSNAISSVVFFADGKKMATAQVDGSIKIWDLTDLKRYRD
jgi:WD40 repeat protein